jgi:hypothetical protein
VNVRTHKKLLIVALLFLITGIVLACVHPRTFARMGAEAFILFGAVAVALLSIRFEAFTLRNNIKGGALILAVLAGQFFGNSASTFPFVSWDMFSTVEYRSPSAIQYKAMLANGDEVDFHPAHQIHATGESRVDVKLEQQIAILQNCRGLEEREKLFTQHQHALAAFVRIYNHRNPNNPITALSLYKTTLRLSGQGKPTRDSTFLWSIDFEDQT